ncbi:hypothetical protein HDU76_004828, partial [Blyttiomyces sp. JEL0837]
MSTICLLNRVAAVHDEQENLQDFNHHPNIISHVNEWTPVTQQYIQQNPKTFYIPTITPPTKTSDFISIDPSLSPEVEQSLATLSNSISSSKDTYHNDPISIAGIAVPFISPHSIEVSLVIPTQNKTNSLIQGYNGLSSWKISGILRVKNRSKDEVLVKEGFVRLDVLDGGRYKTLMGNSGNDKSQMFAYENVWRNEIVECIGDGFRL